MSDEARERLLQALPFMREAVEQAKAQGQVFVGILAKNPDGSGNVVCEFQAPEFFEDIAAVLGAGDLTDEQRKDAEAVRFLDSLGLR